MKKLQKTSTYASLGLIFAFMLIASIYWNIQNSSLLSNREEDNPKITTVTRKNILKTCPDQIMVDSLQVTTKETASNDFNKWTLLISKNTELVNTVSVVLVLGTLFIAVVSLVFFLQIHKIEDYVDKEIEKRMHKATEYSLEMNKRILHAASLQLTMMQHYNELIFVASKPTDESSDDVKIKIKSAQLFERSMRKFVERLKHHRSQFLLLSQTEKEINTGIHNLKGIPLDRGSDLELIEFVVKTWEEYHPKKFKKIDESAVKRILKGLRELKKEIHQELRNKA
ncbi:hypothetical protein CEE37_11465 [candidate division LCP-89 bacterium B3_LCP]|uniref:Uncharacterized protein n=1 Tax=candidate division LCP-89 bacterium B3_LCP TaxID=2012998 RepID=A0A532UVR7_UNCL8|nr:MAG: hypothetical protein CEE37_11465 [candidate division LCP-89 bacterium B3_LCP]